MHAYKSRCRPEAPVSRRFQLSVVCLQVQKNWLYLENIFLGSEDIRKQLPTETAMFDSVNVAFGQRMTALQQVGLALQVSLLPELHEVLLTSRTSAAFFLPHRLRHLECS